MAQVLIIDDHEMTCDVLCKTVQRAGHEASSAMTLESGLQEVLNGEYDVVFLDVWMPDGNGLDVLPQIQAMPAAPEVIIITGAGDPDGAELAIKNGAWDYIEKTSSSKDIVLPLTRALLYREEKKARTPPVALKREGIVGESPRIRACLDRVAQAAGTEGNVLITGETGTGKELFARAIHQNSSRAARNFVVVDCASLPESLVESTLFGHERGAFTGAHRSKEGLVKQADRGTLFLDEVGELPMTLQKAFLRVLQEKRFRPVGGNHEVDSNFRLVTATNRNLDEEVKKGRFREDLLFRLRSFSLELPPLRERKEDIRDLTLHHTALLCARYSIPTKGFSPDFFDVLETHDWPGNVRELVNAIEYALGASRDEVILFPQHLPMNIRIKAARAAVVREVPEPDPSPQPDRRQEVGKFREDRRVALEEFERSYLAELMAKTDSDFRIAMEISGLSQSRLYELLKKHGLTKRT